MANFLLEDVNLNRLVLPKNESTIVSGNAAIWNWEFSPPGYSPRVSSMDRYNNDGAVVVADRRIGDRTFSATCHLTIVETAGGSRAAADAQFQEALEIVYTFFSDDALPVYLIDEDGSKRTKVEMIGFDPSSPASNLLYTVCDYTLQLKMLDLWEDIGITSVASTSGGLGNGGTIVINNQGRRKAFPIISLTALANNSDFTLTNQQTGEFMHVTSTALISGKTIIMSSVDGSITIDDVDQSASVADGSGFISLAPGSNTLQYSSLDGAVTFLAEFRKRYGA